MEIRKAVRSLQAGEEPYKASKAEVQEALETIWVLKGHLKNAQVAYIRVGVLLAKMRDKNLYKALGHEDLEICAQKRLNLAKASLYRYLQVHDWIQKFHREWLEPRPKGFIPDLADAVDLIWIERELAREDLDEKKRAELEELRKKAMDGSLREGELGRWRRQGRRKSEDALKSFLSKLRRMRKEGSELAEMPTDVISLLDEAIGILKDRRALHAAGTHPDKRSKKRHLAPKIVSVKGSNTKR